MMHVRGVFLTGVVFLMRLRAAWGADISAPSQPEKGPGGQEYVYKAVKMSDYGAGDTQYWIFEPDATTTKKAPVIVFCHGWSAMDPNSYRPWINHLVKRGNIVIYPRYQAALSTPPVKFTPNTVTALKDALTELDKPGHAKPDLDRVATLGHSFGGVVCANLAAIAEKEGLPKFKAVMPCEPGTGLFGAGVFEDYSKIPADTLMLCVAGEDDLIVRDIDARKFFTQSSTVPAANKNLIVMLTDKHGFPNSTANHFAPSAIGTGSPLQTYGMWKWFDALTDAAFYGKNRTYALGDTPEQRYMGKWSDGELVKEPQIITKP